MSGSKTFIPTLYFSTDPKGRLACTEVPFFFSCKSAAAFAVEESGRGVTVGVLEDDAAERLEGVATPLVEARRFFAADGGVILSLADALCYRPPSKLLVLSQ